MAKKSNDLHPNIKRIKALSSVFLFFSIYSFGQVTYLPIFLDECTNSSTEEFWFLTDSENMYFPKDDGSKSVVIPEPGTYFLIGIDNRFREIEISQTDNDSVIDTFQIFSLSLKVFVGYSEYTLCNEPADGRLKSYYLNGNLRMEGNFKDGQVLDTLREYYQNGNLKELFIEREKGWKATKYYEKGVLQSECDIAKKFEAHYYPTGKVQQIQSWGKGLHHTIKAYDERGQKTLHEKHRIQKKFYSDGTLKEKIKRKEILVWDRIRSKKKSKFYRSKWSSFDSAGTLKRTIVFYGGSTYSWGHPYPNNLSDIEDYLFQEVVFYQDGKPHKRIFYRTKKEDDHYVEYLVVCTIENGEWIEEMETSIDEVYNIIASFSD